MYEQPSGMLSYIFVDQSIVHSIWAGLFMLTLWCAAWIFLFRLWQEDLWQEHQDWITLVLDAGFHCSVRPVCPYWYFSNENVRVALIGSPFGVRAYVWSTDRIERVSIHLDDLRETIDSLVQEGSISMPQNC